MASWCSAAPPAVQPLCETLIAGYGVTPDALDQGAAYLEYRRDRPRLTTRDSGAHNAQPSAPEIYQPAIEHAEQEFAAHGTSALAILLGQHLGSALPWMPVDDPVLVARLQKTIATVTAAAQAQGIPISTARFRRAQALEWLHTLHAPEGWALRGAPVLKQRSTPAAVRDGTLNCLEFASLYMSGLLLAGIRADFVLEYGNTATWQTTATDGARYTYDHVSVVVYLDNRPTGKRLFVDPMLEYAGPDTGGTAWVILPRLEAGMKYYLNLYELGFTEVPEGPKRDAHRRNALVQARAFAPHNPDVRDAWTAAYNLMPSRASSER
ncbi:MAG: hypothetical protein HY696_13165 [Deltaproteobacteria bacterium]|nr:hypothetical protein [Deltaproteobacteria bacterium]